MTQVQLLVEHKIQSMKSSKGLCQVIDFFWGLEWNLKKQSKFQKYVYRNQPKYIHSCNANKPGQNAQKNVEE